MYSLSERQTRILELIERDGLVSMTSLTEQLGEAAETIQTEIDLLCEQGLLQRHENQAGPLS
ncbi:MAG: DeoR family transcriptional regulator, partial [Candidatus Competibacteraceae bacterium]